MGESGRPDRSGSAGRLNGRHHQPGVLVFLALGRFAVDVVLEVVGNDFALGRHAVDFQRYLWTIIILLF